MNDVNTPQGMLRHLLCQNESGVWFVKIDEGRYATLPRWMWGHCRRACPDAPILKANDHG